jgi:hypothetical protein
MAIDYDVAATQYHMTSSTPVTGVPFSMACWFNPDNVSSALTLLSIADNASTNNYFSMMAQGAIAGDPVRLAAADGGSASNCDSITPPGYTANAWHHACAVCATSTDRAVYLNGGNVGTDENERIPAGLDRIGIGVRAASTPTVLMNGRLAEVAIWDAALTAAEVAALGAKAFSPLCIRPANLVFYPPHVRNVQDIIGGLTLTATGTPTVADHPRIIYPSRSQIAFTAAAVAQMVPTPLHGRMHRIPAFHK